MANEGRGTSTLEGSPKGSGAASEAPLPFPLPSSYIFVGGTNPVAGVNPTRVSLHNVCGLYTNAVNRSRRLVDHRASITAAGNEGLPHALREPWPGRTRLLGMATAHAHPPPSPYEPVMRTARSAACETASGIVCECHRSPELQLLDVAVAEQRSLLTRAAAAPASGKASGRGRTYHSRGGDRGGGDASSCVLYEEDGGIATLTLNRPKTKHSVNRAVFSRLAELLQRAERSESVLAVVLTGSEGYFTSGADIKELQNDGISNVPMLQQPFGVFSKAVLNFPKLLIAAVNGPAVGVGVTLLPHCDAVYAYGGKQETTTQPPTASTGKPADAPGASRDVGERQRRLRDSGRGDGGGQQFASFWTPFFRLAIVPEFCSSVTFPEILGWPLANEMLVMGRKLSAREALASGLVSTVLTADSESEFLEKVKLELRRNVLGTYAAAESVGIFKSIMWRERRPRLLRVFADECAELDRRVQAGRPKAALKHLARHPPPAGSKL